MTKIKCLSKLSVFIANLTKLEDCLFFKEDLHRCHSQSRNSQETGSGDLRRQAAALCYALCCSQEQHRSSFWCYLHSDGIFSNDLEKSINSSHRLYVNESKTFLTRWSIFITFCEAEPKQACDVGATWLKMHLNFCSHPENMPHILSHTKN